jgi:ribonuclease T1
VSRAGLRRSGPGWAVAAVALALVTGGCQPGGTGGAVGTAGTGSTAGATGTDTRPDDGIDACPAEVLPAELDPVLDDIDDGGPFPHPERDGTTFGNYEGLLPAEDHGYYREHTVQTPGLSHRGARRVVTGGTAATDPEVWYFTDDHYESFCEFAP